MAWEITGNNGTNPNPPNNNFLGTIDSQPLVIRTTKTERLRVDANGNVGIGTTDPGARLQVSEGHIGILGTSDAFDQTLWLQNNVGKTLRLTVGANGGGTAWYTQANTGTLGVDSGMDLRFSAGAAEAMRISATGNVGIGVNNPTLALDVHGRIRLRDGTAGPPAASAGVWFNTANEFGPDGIADIGFIGAVDPTRIGLFGNDPRGGSQWGFTFDTVTGNVGIGTGTGFPDAKLQVNGDIFVMGDIKLANADCAEEFDVSEAQQVEPGTVMVVGEEGTLHHSHQAYDKRVAGVISGAGDFKPGIVLDKQQKRTGRQPIALLGKVYCKVDAGYAPVAIGDLLTTSPTPGHAMKATDQIKAFGAVIGKALRPLREGQELIPILIALQ